MLDRIKENVRERLIQETVNNTLIIEKIQENAFPYVQMMTFYRCAIMEVETKFRVLNQEFSLEYDRNPIEAIKSRLKSDDSIIKKLKKKDLPFTTQAIEENIYDVAGVRIVCSFTEDIYRLADCLLAQDDIKLIEKKDYIQNPKNSGYRSLHLIVEVPIFLQNEKRPMKVEVQLRTLSMDCWASLEHKIRYKKDISPEDIEEVERELLQCSNMCAELDKRMGDIKTRIDQSNETTE